MQQPQGRPQKIQVEMGDKLPDEVYSNLQFINFSPAEFIVDFARFSPGHTKARIHARIIINPTTAKGLLKNLENAVSKYENQFGEIKLFGQQDKTIGFQSPDKAE
ncbi:MAG: DUF3467 domain-containing protein [candidate division Zixibacteria bacterium]|jgi:hypothetical protein|nr:DUF3467 domain-containing protein [candidate division Zixibacteria bacterium]